MPINDLMTVTEVAALLRVRPETIYRYIRTKTIPFYRIGGTIRFERDTLMEWMHSCAQEKQ